MEVRARETERPTAAEQLDSPPHHDMSAPSKSAAPLARAATRSATALVLRTALVMAAGFLRVALVARFLNPEDLGVFALITATVEAARALGTLGPSAVVIQRPTLDDVALGTYRSFRVLQAAAIAALVLAAYPALQLSERLTASSLHLHVLAAGAVLLSGLVSSGDVPAARNAQFGRVAAIESAATLFDLAASSALAYWLRSPAALGIAMLLRAALETSLSYVAFPRTVPFRLDRATSREFLATGTHFVSLAIGSYVTIYGDNALIAALFGTGALGLYVVAYRLAELPLSAVLSVAKRVLFPVLSRLHADTSLRASALRDALTWQQALLWPAAIGSAVFSDLLIVWLYGADYRDAAPVLTALWLLTIARGTTNIVSNLLQSTGRYDVIARLKWLGVAVFVPGVLLGSLTAGLVGAALGAGVSYSTAAVAGLTQTARAFQVNVRTFARPILSPAVIAVGAGAAASALRHVVPGPVAILAYVALYAAAFAVVERDLLGRATSLVRGTIASPRSSPTPS